MPCFYTKMSYCTLIFAWRFSTSKNNFTDRVSEICILKCRHRSWQSFCSDLKVDAPRGDAKAFHKCGATQHVLCWRFWKHCKEIHILDLLMNKIDNNLHIHVGTDIVYVLISTLSFFRLQTGRRHGDESEACCRYWRLCQSLQKGSLGHNNMFRWHLNILVSCVKWTSINWEVTSGG